MKIPSKIIRHLSELCLEDSIKIKKEKKARKAYEKKQAIKQQKEDAKKDLKLESAEYIFSWKKEFLETLEGQVMFNKCNERLEIFGGSWGHTLDVKKDYGCWSRIYIIENGLEYVQGYKWMPGSSKKFANSEEMVKTLNFEYLKLLENKIKDEKIFENILRLNNFK